MSNIFEALQNQKNISDPALSVLLKDCAEAPAVAPAPAPAPVTQAVPAPLSQAPLVSTAHGAAPRTVALRIASPSPLLPFDESQRMASEQYRIIRTKILQHPARPRVILVTSADTGDGKSVSAINLAGALSLKSDSSVLLVDGDFRRSAIHNQLGIPREPGLTEILRGVCTLDQALLRTAGFPNLYILPAGGHAENPSELLDSPVWRAVCSDIRARFGHAIVDSPPAGRVADYDLLLEAADGVIAVVRPDHTKRKLCFKMLESIPKQKLLGVVMNCVEEWFLAPEQSGAYAYYGTATATR